MITTKAVLALVAWVALRDKRGTGYRDEGGTEKRILIGLAQKVAAEAREQEWERIAAAVRALPVHWVGGYEWDCETTSTDGSGEVCTFWDTRTHDDGLVSARDLAAITERSTPE